MSQRKRKFKRIDAFFSRVRPLTPDSLPGEAAEKSADTDAGPPTATPPSDGWQNFFSGIEPGTMFGFAFEGGKVTAWKEAPPPLSGNAFRVPLTVSGKPAGAVQVTRKDPGWTAREVEIVNDVAAQLSQHLEALRRKGSHGGL
jgi:hypothetical protein